MNSSLFSSRKSKNLAFSCDRWPLNYEGQDGAGETPGRCGEAEEHEDPPVATANTVVYEGTMMVQTLILEREKGSVRERERESECVGERVWRVEIVAGLLTS